jgi:hypothetical protein
MRMPVCAASHDLGSMGIDRINVPGKAVARQEMDDPPAELGDALGSAEHRDRARVEDALDGDARRGTALKAVRSMENHDFHFKYGTADERR